MSPRHPYCPVCGRQTEPKSPNAAAAAARRRRTRLLQLESEQKELEERLQANLVEQEQLRRGAPVGES